MASEELDIKQLVKAVSLCTEIQICNFFIRHVAVGECRLVRVRCLERNAEISLRKAGVRIKGTLGDIDPLNKVPVKRARSRVKKGHI